jgi:hypothetical protein
MYLLMDFLYLHSPSADSVRLRLATDQVLSAMQSITIPVDRPSSVDGLNNISAQLISDVVIRYLALKQYKLYMLQ